MELVGITRSLRRPTAMVTVGALLASGWDFSLPLGAGLSLRLVDVLAAAAAASVIIAATAGWLPRLEPIGALFLGLLAVLGFLAAVGQLTGGLPVRDATFGIRTTYLTVFALAATLGFEEGQAKPRPLLNFLALGAILQATLVLGQYALFLAFGPRGALAVDLGVKMAHLRDADDPLWWVGEVVRPTGSFSHPNAAGAFLAVGFLASLAWALPTPERRGRFTRAIPPVLLATAAVVTGSRGALIVLGLPSLFLVTSAKVRPSVRALLVMGTSVLMAIALLANAPGAPALEQPFAGNPWQGGPGAKTLSRFGSILQLSQLQTARGRVATWRDGTSLIGDYPQGAGLTHVLAGLRSASGVGAAHNSYLLVAAALGVPMGAVFLALCGFAAHRCHARARDAQSDSTEWRIATAVIAGFLISLLLEDRVQDMTSLVGPGVLFGLALLRPADHGVRP